MHDLSQERKVISFFVPVKNEIENLPRLRAEIDKFRSWLLGKKIDLDVFVHDNGSTDGSWEYLEDWARIEKIRAFKLKRDIGYQESLALAFDNAVGDAFVIFQSDMQDPIEAVMEMAKHWMIGKKAIVGVPIARDESISERIGRRIFVSLFKRSTDFQQHEWFTDFYLLDKSIYTSFRGLPLVNQFIRGKLLEEVRFDEILRYTRLKRSAGKTSFNFTRRYNLAVSALLLHSSRSIRKLLVVSILVGFLSITLTGALLILAFLDVLSSNKIGLYGISLLILVNANIMTILFGIVLEYLARIHARLQAEDAIISRSNLYAKKIT